MSAEKAELRAATIQELGTRIDDLLEASTAAVHQAEGAEAALMQAAEMVRALHEHVDKDVDAQIIKTLPEAEVIKRWITRAVHALEQLAANATRAKTVQKGHSQGVNSVVQLLKRAHDHELDVGAQHAERNGGAGHIPVKQRRLAEEAQRASTLPPPASPTMPPPNGAHVSSPRRRRKVESGPDA